MVNEMRERNSKIENIMAAVVRAKRAAKVGITEDKCLNRAQRRAIAAIKGRKK
jgi:hypothetical protein